MVKEHMCIWFAGRSVTSMTPYISPAVVETCERDMAETAVSVWVFE